MTNIKLDRHFFIIAMTQKLFAGFYLNLYPIVVMKFFIVTHNFLFFFLIPTVSYWACPTWYVSSVTPLSLTVICLLKKLTGLAVYVMCKGRGEINFFSFWTERDPFWKEKKNVWKNIMFESADEVKAYKTIRVFFPFYLFINYSINPVSIYSTHQTIRYTTNFQFILKALRVLTKTSISF
jgi:hypothetical protein